MNDASVTVYWRPGCLFCTALLRGLDGAGLPMRRHNIWEDEQAAAFVRSVAGGNETVPTVRVGDLALVNPTVRDVLDAVSVHAPALLPDGYEPRQPGRLAGLLRRVLGG